MLKLRPAWLQAWNFNPRPKPPGAPQGHRHSTPGQKPRCPTAPQAEGVPRQHPLPADLPPSLTPSEASSDFCLKGLEVEVGVGRAPRGSRLPLVMALRSGGPQPAPASLRVCEEGPWEPWHPSPRKANQSFGLAAGRTATSLRQAPASFSNPGEKLSPSGQLTLLQPLSQTCLEGDLLGWATEKLQGCPPDAMTAWNLS